MIWVAYPVIALSATLFDVLGAGGERVPAPARPEDELVAANALNALNNNLARLVGPALGGILYLAGGLTLVTVADAATFPAPRCCSRSYASAAGPTAEHVTTSPRRRPARSPASGTSGSTGSGASVARVRSR